MLSNVVGRGGAVEARMGRTDHAGRLGFGELFGEAGDRGASRSAVQQQEGSPGAGIGNRDGHWADIVDKHSVGSADGHGALLPGSNQAKSVAGTVA
jgi:hypothetical protein